MKASLASTDTNKSVHMLISKEIPELMSVLGNTGRCLCTLLALAGIGCNQQPFEMAPVSGRVTLDGEPLAGAKIAFNPTMRSDSPIVGPGSIGKTDERGYYRLQTFEGVPGVVVGPHTVQMSTIVFGKVDEDTEQAEILRPNVIPEHYRATGALVFEVPPGGTENADFELASDP